jgi:hypothetical protein
VKEGIKNDKTMVNGKSKAYSLSLNSLVDRILQSELEEVVKEKILLF